MKCKWVLKSLTLFMLVICTVVASVFFASAVDDVFPDDELQVVTQEETPEETFPEPATEYVPDVTEAPEEETDPPMQEPEQIETDPEDTTENRQNEPEYENKNENQQSGQGETVQTKTLPTVAPTTEKRVVNKDDLTYGYVSWACVVAGILVLLIVFISIKKQSIQNKSKGKRR